MLLFFARFILSIVLSSTTSVAYNSAPTVRPNIIFFLADDMGWNDVSFHGYNEIRTPNIDQLANEGVILNSYYSQYMCTPSRSALMTGKYPTRLGLQHFVLGLGEPRGLEPTIKILPQYLKDAGYKTHMIGKWHLGYYQRKMTPTFRGFDSFFGYYIGQTDYYNYTPTQNVPPEYLGFDLWDNLEPGWPYIGQYSTELFTEKAVRLINDHNVSQPLFLYFSHMAPHYANQYDPVQAPQKYIDRFPHIANEGRRKYAATMSALDDSIGTVMATLKSKGMADNSVIVFASDNGGAGPEQGDFFGPPSTFANNWPLKGAKSSQWEGGLRVTACVWSPLLEKKSRVSEELYHITDWLPTFMRLAGTPGRLAGIDGYDIWDSVSKGLPSPRTEILHQIDPVWNEYAFRWNQYKLVSGSHGSPTGLHIDQWYVPEGGIDPKYLINVPGALKCENIDTAVRVPCDANVAPCLYDIRNDPCEYRNIAKEYTDIVGFLLDKIAYFNKTTLPSDNLPKDPRARAFLNNGLIQPWQP